MMPFQKLTLAFLRVKFGKGAENGHSLQQRLEDKQLNIISRYFIGLATFHKCYSHAPSRKSMRDFAKTLMRHKSYINVSYKKTLGEADIPAFGRRRQEALGGGYG